MPIPGQSITIQDPGLGLTTPATNIPLHMGASSSGTDNVVVSFSNVGDVVPALGEGPLPEYVTRQLQISGGPVLAMKLAATIVGVSGSVTASGGGPTVSLAGEPFDSYEAVITIVVGGILGTGTFSYTLDGGTSESGTLVIPGGGSFPIPNTNIVVTFATGTYVADETYSWTSTEPQNNATDTSAGFTALALLNVTYDFITLATTYTDATAAAAAFAANDGHLTSLFNDFEYQRLIQDAGPDDTSTTITAFNTTSTRVNVCYETATAPSAKPFVGRSTRKSSLALGCSIEAGIALLSTDLARVANGPMGGVTAIGHDESVNEVMDQEKFTTARTWKGRSGFFLTNARFKSPVGSDFLFWQLGRIIDVSSEIVQVTQQGFISRGVRTVVNGVIDDRDATGLETEVNTPLAIALTSPSNVEGTQGHVTGFEYKIDRTNNVLSSQTVISELRVKPFGYIKDIITTIGFSATLSTDEEASE